jgi:hypothetical protein
MKNSTINKTLVLLGALCVTGAFSVFAPVVTALTINQTTQAKSSFAITGSISKGSGTFLIDHPLDPSNKLLYHSFVESPDVKNIYNGVAILDDNGSATVRLPSYFDALNNRARYQFSPIGEPMPNLHIGSTESVNKFTLVGGVPGGKVSWQITGIRHDPYILKNPIRNEVSKGPNEVVNVGVCVYEPLCK